MFLYDFVILFFKKFLTKTFGPSVLSPHPSPVGGGTAPDLDNGPEKRRVVICLAKCLVVPSLAAQTGVPTESAEGP